MTSFLLLLSMVAFAGEPATLDDLVGIALDRDPEAATLGYEGDAARWRADAAGRPMPPELMFGVNALGAPKGAADPTMVMVGATQMFRGYGEARAWRYRLALDSTRTEADRERLEADVRARLWQLAAGIRARQEERALLDTQITSAEALLQIGLARFGAGASGAAGGMPGSGGGMGGMSGGAPMSPMAGTRPPAVQASASTAGGMAGMGGSGGGGSAPIGPMPSAAGGAMASSAPATAMGGGDGLSALLRLDAERARLEAERAGLDAELVGDFEVLNAFVGDEGVDAVRSDASAFLGLVAEVDVPERALASIDRDAAQASVDVARSQRNPGFMVSVGERFMPEDLGMPAGTDVAVGVQLPLWGSQGRTIAAARADVQAADARADRVERDLVVAQASARAGWEAAKARSAALDESVVPRARQAWDVSQSQYAAGRASADEAVRAWETLIQSEREAVLARRDVELRAAELVRLGGE